MACTLSFFTCLSFVQVFSCSITADGLSNDNMTNLAIKGILAIRTMAEISHTFDNTHDYNNYLVCIHSIIFPLRFLTLFQSIVSPLSPRTLLLLWSPNGRISRNLPAI